MRTYATLAACYRQPLALKLLAGRLRPIPRLTNKLQETQVVLFQFEAINRRLPPLLRTCRQVSGWLRLAISD